MADTRDLKSLGVTTVRVRAPPPAPNLGTTYDTKTVIQIGWLFLYIARKPLKTLGVSASRMPRQALRSPAFHGGVWAAKMAEKTAAGLHPFGNGQGCMARPRRGRPRQNQPSAKRFYFFAEGFFLKPYAAVKPFSERAAAMAGSAGPLSVPALSMM